MELPLLEVHAPVHVSLGLVCHLLIDSEEFFVFWTAPLYHFYELRVSSLNLWLGWLVCFCSLNGVPSWTAVLYFHVVILVSLPLWCGHFVSSLRSPHLSRLQKYRTVCSYKKVVFLSITCRSLIYLKQVSNIPLGGGHTLFVVPPPMDSYLFHYCLMPTWSKVSFHSVWACF